VRFPNPRAFLGSSGLAALPGAVDRFGGAVGGVVIEEGYRRRRGVAGGPAELGDLVEPGQELTPDRVAERGHGAFAGASVGIGVATSRPSLSQNRLFVWISCDGGLVLAQPECGVVARENGFLGVEADEVFCGR